MHAGLARVFKVHIKGPGEVVQARGCRQWESAYKGSLDNHTWSLPACRERTQPRFCCWRDGSPLTGTPRRGQLGARTQGEQCHLKGSFIGARRGFCPQISSFWPLKLECFKCIPGRHINSSLYSSHFGDDIPWEPT